MALDLEKKADTSKAKSRPQKRLGKWGKRLIILVVIAALGLGIGSRFFRSRQPVAVTSGNRTYSTAEVTYRDITSTITGSGTLEAANSYSVTSLVEGTILAADFEEGDKVSEGQLLYAIDAANASSSLERAQISLEQAQRNYSTQLKSREGLTVEATISGQVVALNVEEGDDVTNNQTVATLRNTRVMKLTVPFPADDIPNFYVGQAATVTLDSTFETLDATVTKISVLDEVRTGNMIVRNVTLEVQNPGGLSVSQVATAEINGVGSSAGGTFAYKDEGTVTAKLSGEVASLRIAEGDWVEKGQILMILTSESLDNSIQSASESLRTAQLSLESQNDQLDNYNITSPIQGTIIDKNFKAGETSEAGRVLCTIYDLSYLTMTLSVDELDISDIRVGQEVSITADAVSNRGYTGVVTKVSVAGTSSGGTTTYPVTVRIDETRGLLPGMNVDATITLQSASDVLAIPSGALNRGNTVLVTADSPSAGGGTPMEGSQEEYYSVAVEIGTSDSSYIEIVSGLQEGDTVAYIPTTSSGGFGMMMGGMPGSPMGGGMGGVPSGGMGGPSGMGGAPSGRTGGNRGGS